MKYMINDKVVLSRPPEGPLADHMSSFTGWVSEQGYAASSLWQRDILPLVSVAGWESEVFAYEAFHPSIRHSTAVSRAPSAANS